MCFNGYRKIAILQCSCGISGDIPFQNRLQSPLVEIFHYAMVQAFCKLRFRLHTKLHLRHLLGFFHLALQILRPFDFVTQALVFLGTANSLTDLFAFVTREMVEEGIGQR